MGSAFMNLATVHIQDSHGRLEAVSAPITRRILEAASRGMGFVTDSDTRDIRFVYDFKKMERFDARTGKTETLIIEVSWGASMMRTVVNRDKSLRRPVLEMAVDRIRTNPILASILAAKGLTNCQIKENPYLRSDHTSYINFIDTLLALCDKGGSAGEKRYSNILKAAGNSRDEKRDSRLRKGGLKVVFHGTNQQVMDKILKEGLDPSYRASHLHEDYFGVEYRTSKSYTLARSKNPRVVTVASDEEELPIAEITLNEKLQWTISKGFKLRMTSG